MKKLLAMLVAGIMVCSLAACGGAEEKKKTNTAVEEEASSETDAEDSSTEDTNSSDDKFVIGYSNRLDSATFLMDLKTAFDEAASADASLEVLYADANGDSQKQLEQIDNFFVQGIDCLVVIPNDGESIVSAIEEANKKDIPVIVLSTEATGGEYYFVGISNVECGVLQGEYMKEALPENAKVLYLGGSSIYQISADRKEGFYEGLGDRTNDVEILSEQECQYSIDDGMRIMEDWIQTYPEFDAVVCVNDDSAMGAIQALKGANILDGKLVAGIDATEDAKAAVKNGELTMTVMQDPAAQAQAVYDAAKVLQSGKEPEKVIETPLVAITADNIDKYME